MTKLPLTPNLMLVLALTVALAGCASPQRLQPFTPETRTTPSLATLPLPPEPVVAAVYDFPDMTGQHRETEAGAR